MPFSTSIVVRFGDCDPAGLVYFPVLMHYCHVAMEQFFAARCGVEYHRLVREQGLGFPTVKAEAEFTAPFVYGDAAEVEVWVSRTGDSSATFEYRLRRGAGGPLCARATLVQVATDIAARRAVPIPERLRRPFAESAL